jgi:hypothetical protein
MNNKVEEVKALIKFGANVNATASDVSETKTTFSPIGLFTNNRLFNICLDNISEECVTCYSHVSMISLCWIHWKKKMKFQEFAFTCILFMCGTYIYIYFIY